VEGGFCPGKSFARVGVVGKNAIALAILFTLPLAIDVSVAEAPTPPANASTPQSPLTGPSIQSSPWRTGCVLASSQDGASVTISSVTAPEQECDSAKAEAFIVPEGLRAIVQQYVAGDWVHYKAAESPAHSHSLTEVLPEIQRPTLRKRLGYFVTSLVVVVVLFWAPIRWAGKFPSQILIGKDGRVSNSKVQAAAWFLIVLSAYLAMAGIRFSYHRSPSIAFPAIPSNLLILAGLSGFTFGAAKLITTQQISQAPSSLPSPASGGAPDPPPSASVVVGSSLRTSPWLLKEATNWIAKPPSDRASPMDLFTDDMGRIDFGDTQIVVLTSLGIAVFAVLVLNAMGAMPMVHGASLPDLDAGLVALLGVSQGSYLMKKFSG